MYVDHARARAYPTSASVRSGPRARAKININRFTFERGCGTRLHSINWRDHFLHCRKARQFCALLRDAVDYLRGAWLLFNIVSKILFLILWSIPAIGGILVFFWGIIQALVHIAFLVVWIVATVKAFTGVRWDIPYIGPVARRQEGTV